MPYLAQKFDIPELEGISKRSLDEHISLYEGYVKNFNSMTELATNLMQDSEKNAHAISEIMRRRSFEFGGMRLHELYFSQFEQGSTLLTSKNISESSSLFSALKEQYTNPEYAIMEVRQVAMMRGPGWSMLYYDPLAKKFLVGFSGEQHQGHFVTLPVILALDVWEHAYILDYGTGGRAKYVDAFFKNLNWSVIEKRFADVANR